MSIQYSGGTLKNNTFIPTTRAEWVGNVTQALSDAGWTTISGTPGSTTAGTDVTLESAAQNSSAKIRFRFFDPNVNNCAQVTMKHPTGSPTSQIGYALPTAGTGQWRVVANKFHFFAFATGGAANSIAPRGWLFGGTFFTPSFLGVVSGDGVGFFSSGGTTDADATSRSYWRRSLRPPTTNPSVHSLIWGASLLDISSAAAVAAGPTLSWWQGTRSAFDDGFQWADGTLPVYEALVAFGITATTDSAKLRGQLYDAMVINGQWTSESTFSFDGHSWLTITDDSNATLLGATASLVLAIP